MILNLANIDFMWRSLRQFTEVFLRVQEGIEGLEASDILSASYSDVNFAFLIQTRDAQETEIALSISEDTLTVEYGKVCRDYDLDLATECETLFDDLHNWLVYGELDV